MTTLAPPLPPPAATVSPLSSDDEPIQRRPRALQPWIFRLVALATVATSVAIDRSIVFLLPVLFLLVVPFEKMFPRHRGQRIRRPQAALDVRYALTAALFGIASIAVGLIIAVVSLAWLPGLALRPLVAMLPGWLMPFVGVAVFDLAIYWAHRWSHEVPVLWRFHAVHHSTEHLDWISGFRNHPFDGAVVAPPAVFLLAAGFDAEFTGVLAVVQVITGLFLHANVRWRWKPLQRIVITPEFHHWHHSYEPDAHCSNYSVFLPLWDIMFGTYYMPTNRRPVRYGVSEDMPTTMWGQLRFPFRGVRTVSQMLRHPWRSIRDGMRVPKRIVIDVWRSSTRPRTLRPKPGDPLPWALIPPSTATDPIVHEL
jgi:sterol desaturase/sphingolipid hydroxylase (fatty acid hydroxylase superfamily)